MSVLEDRSALEAIPNTEKVQKKNRLILKHPKNQNPAEKVSLVKRINEGYFLFHLFLF